MRDGETLDQALKRLNRLVGLDNDRPWTKRRYGYSETPSALRRKKHKMRKITALRGQGYRTFIGGEGRISLRLAIGREAQWQHTGPINAAGR